MKTLSLALIFLVVSKRLNANTGNCLVSDSSTAKSSGYFSYPLDVFDNSENYFDPLKKYVA